MVGVAFHSPADTVGAGFKTGLGISFQIGGMRLNETKGGRNY